MNAIRVSKRAGRGLGMAILLVAGLRPVRASEVTITVVGETQGGSDPSHYFTPVERNGYPASIIFAFDDTKGKPLKGNCGNVLSGADGQAQDSPGTAVVTINGKSITVGGKWNSHSTAFRSIPSACSDSLIKFEVDNNVRGGLIASGQMVDVQLIPEKGNVLTKDVDWRAALTPTNLDAFFSKAHFAIPVVPGGTSGADFGIVIKSVTISGPHAGPEHSAEVVMPLIPTPVAPPVVKPTGQLATKIYALVRTRQECAVVEFTGAGQFVSLTHGLLDGCTGIAVDPSGVMCVSWNQLKLAQAVCSVGDKVVSSVNGHGAMGIALGLGKMFLSIPHDDPYSMVIKAATMDGKPAAPYFATGLYNLNAIAVDPSGKIHIAVAVNNAVRTFGQDCEETGPTITYGLSDPRALAVGYDGRIYVASAMRVTAYLPDGRWTTPVIAYTNPNTRGVVTPKAVATDAGGRTYVGYEDGAVGIYDQDGKQIGGFFSGGRVIGLAVH